MRNIRFTTHQYLKTTFEFTSKSNWHRLSDLSMWPYTMLFGHYHMHLQQLVPAQITEKNTRIEHTTSSLSAQLLAFCLSPLLIISIPIRCLSYYLAFNSEAQAMINQVMSAYLREQFLRAVMRGEVSPNRSALFSIAPNFDDISSRISKLSTIILSVNDRLQQYESLSEEDKLAKVYDDVLRDFLNICHAIRNHQEDDEEQIQFQQAYNTAFRNLVTIHTLILNSSLFQDDKVLEFENCTQKVFEIAKESFPEFNCT